MPTQASTQANRILWRRRLAVPLMQGDRIDAQLSVMSGEYRGRSTRRFRMLAANQRAKRLPCWLCGQPVVYDNNDDPHSFTVDHEKPLSTHPELAEEPMNLRTAGSRCNSSRGNRPPQPSLGATSRDW